MTNPRLCRGFVFGRRPNERGRGLLAQPPTAPHPLTTRPPKPTGQAGTAIRLHRRQNLHGTDRPPRAAPPNRCAPYRKNACIPHKAHVHEGGVTIALLAALSGQVCSVVSPLPQGASHEKQALGRGAVGRMADHRPPPPASAQIMPITPDLGWSMSINAGNYILSNNTIRESAKKRGTNLPVDPPGSGRNRVRGERDGASSESRPAPAVNTRFTPSSAARGRGMEELVNRFPAAQRAEARHNLQLAYDAWPQVARQLDVPTNDMGSALAAFLIGSWMAYNDRQYPDEQFKLAAEQMRHVLAEIPDFARAGNADKQAMHEQLVSLGMVAALSYAHLKQNPDPAVQRELRRMAAQNLRSFLQTDPSRVHVRSDGILEIR